MYSLKTSYSVSSLLILSTLIILALQLSACDEKSITLQPEHLSVADLKAELNRELNKEIKTNTHREQKSLPSLTVNNNENNLIIKGSSGQIANVISIATRLDRPSSYYLEVRNTPINAISTHTESMQILLHPEQTISLGHLTLSNSPWKPLIKEQEKFLQLHLNNQLILSIEIKDQHDKQANYYSGKHPMQLNQWLMAFNETETTQGKRIITSKQKKQLWLRLIKANSQSGINLR